MAAYTADAVSLLTSLVDALPPAADRLFAEAEAGETVLQTPSTALSEVLYAVSRDRDVREVTLPGSPETARRGLVDNGSIAVAPVGKPELSEYAGLAAEFSIHDGLIVASLRAEATEAIVTSDDVIRDAGDETVWA